MSGTAPRQRPGTAPGQWVKYVILLHTAMATGHAVAGSAEQRSDTTAAEGMTVGVRVAGPDTKSPVQPKRGPKSGDMNLLHPRTTSGQHTRTGESHTGSGHRPHLTNKTRTARDSRGNPPPPGVRRCHSSAASHPEQRRSSRPPKLRDCSPRPAARDSFAPLNLTFASAAALQQPSAVAPRRRRRASARSGQRLGFCKL